MPGLDRCVVTQMPFRSSIPRRHPGLINYCVSFPLLCNQSPQLHNTWTLAHRSQSVWLTRFSAQGPTKLESRCARAGVSPEAPSSSVAVADSSSSRRGIEVPFPSGRRLGALAAPGSRRCPLPRSLHHPQSQQWEITPTSSPRLMSALCNIRRCPAWAALLTGNLWEWNRSCRSSSRRRPEGRLAA